MPSHTVVHEQHGPVALLRLDRPERRTFNDINRREGLQAAIAWRESRFGGEDV